VGSGTNINLAFITAKNAMKSAKNSKDRQFVIFFSDGEATASIPSIKDQNDFQKGVDVPTSFTVYLQIRLNPNGETIDSANVELKSSLESIPVTLSKNE
jgi:hypothetical protein